MCVNSSGTPLASEVFDRDSGMLRIDAASAQGIGGAIECEVANQTAHVSFVTQTTEGHTAVPANGWGIELVPADSSAAIMIDDERPSVEMTPGTYEVVGHVPPGLGLRALQRLDDTTQECVGQTQAPSVAAERCWKPVLDGQAVDIPQGSHAVFRVVSHAVSPPALPNTGGVSLPIAVLSGAAFILAAALFGASRLRLTVTER